MTHTKYDFDGAMNSAVLAAVRTKKPRFVKLQATGWDILTSRPKSNPYGYYEVQPDGGVAVFEP